ncbi:MAG: hypothetical protein ACXU8N_03010 [Telluria sp.]
MLPGLPLALALAGALPGPAPPAGAGQPPPVAQRPSTPRPPLVASVDAGFGPAAPAGTLAGARGGDEPASTMTLTGTVGGNTATNVGSGANIIAAGSFANAAGMPMVIQNSGANVLIQNATIINLKVN